MQAAQDIENLSPLQKEILKKWQSKQDKGIPQAIKDDLQRSFDGEVLFDEPMAPHTYIKIGGNADVFLKPKSKEAIAHAVSIARENGIPYHFHGSGANTLVKDGGVRGFVISLYNVLHGFKVIEEESHHIDIEADAGLSFNKLIHAARDLGACDLTPFTGIPGSVGGLVSMNAGTQVREIKDVVRSLTILNHKNELVIIPRERLDFQYRHLKLPKTNVILSAVIRLQQLEGKGEAESQIKSYQQKRSDTQPIDYPNLGSMFKNPQPLHKNDVVVAAGQLIEETGLKNIRIGGARISQKHANFIINEGQATAKDVLSLMSLIKDKVKQMHGIALEPEIKVIGEDEE